MSCMDDRLTRDWSASECTEERSCLKHGHDVSRYVRDSAFRYSSIRIGQEMVLECLRVDHTASDTTSTRRIIMDTQERKD